MSFCCSETPLPRTKCRRRVFSFPRELLLYWPYERTSRGSDHHRSRLTLFHLCCFLGIISQKSGPVNDSSGIEPIEWVMKIWILTEKCRNHDCKNLRRKRCSTCSRELCCQLLSLRMPLQIFLHWSTDILDPALGLEEFCWGNFSEEMQSSLNVLFRL